MLKEQSCTMSLILWAVAIFRCLSPLNHVKPVISNNFFSSMKCLPHLLLYSTVESTPASSKTICTCWIEVNFQPYLQLDKTIWLLFSPSSLSAPSSKFTSQASCLSHPHFHLVISTWLWNLLWRDSHHFPSKGVHWGIQTHRPFNFLCSFLSRGLESWHPWCRES